MRMGKDKKTDDNKPLSHADLVAHFAGRKGRWAVHIDKNRDAFVDDLPQLLTSLSDTCVCSDQDAPFVLAQIRRGLISLYAKTLDLSYEPEDWEKAERITQMQQEQPHDRP